MLSIVAVAGWILIVIGLIALVSSLRGRKALAWQMIMPGIVMLASGLLVGVPTAAMRDIAVVRRRFMTA